MGLSDKQQRARRFEAAYKFLYDARLLMTESITYIDDGIDRNKVLAAMEKADYAQKLMHDMVLEIYKAEEDAR